MSLPLNPVDRLEILRLQDNYIDIASGDSNEMIQRVLPLKEGELRNTVFWRNTVSRP